MEWPKGAADQGLDHWPRKSPDLTPCDFSLRKYVKDKNFIPLPADNDKT